MLHRTIVSAGLTAALSLSIIPSALALTSDDVLAKQQSLKAVEMCDGKSGTFRGKCITDVIKRIAMLRDELKDALEIERAQWYAEHAHLGVSTEYTKALQAYTKEVSAKRKLFNTQQREIEKIFFTKQKEALRTQQSGSSSSRSGRSINTTDLESAEQKCANQRSDTARRICLRQQLRLMDPAARRMGAPLRSSANQ